MALANNKVLPQQSIYKYILHAGTSDRLRLSALIANATGFLHVPSN